MPQPCPQLRLGWLPPGPPSPCPSSDPRGWLVGLRGSRRPSCIDQRLALYTLSAGSLSRFLARCDPCPFSFPPILDPPRPAPSRRGLQVVGYEGFGTIQFVGKHQLQNVIRVGVGLDAPVGKNNGTVSKTLDSGKIRKDTWVPAALSAPSPSFFLFLKLEECRRGLLLQGVVRGL